MIPAEKLRIDRSLALAVQDKNVHLEQYRPFGDGCLTALAFFDENRKPCFLVSLITSSPDEMVFRPLSLEDQGFVGGHHSDQRYIEIDSSELASRLWAGVVEAYSAK